MPRGDRRGPAGMGPMTGRRMGFCSGYAAPGYASAGFGMGRGWGRGFGRMRYAAGFPGWVGYGAGAYPQDFAPYPYQGAAPGVNEKEVLQNQADILQQQLNAVRQQLENLGKTDE